MRVPGTLSDSFTLDHYTHCCYFFLRAIIIIYLFIFYCYYLFFTFLTIKYFSEQYRIFRLLVNCEIPFFTQNHFSWFYCHIWNSDLTCWWTRKALLKICNILSIVSISSYDFLRNHKNVYWDISYISKTCILFDIQKTLTK